MNISIKNARTNNLKEISLEIPHHKLIVVTGVSGSGKSSLAFDIIAREGQRRYFETMPGFARQFLGKLNQPDVDSVEGLSPVIAIEQKTTSANARSTVGTISDVYDLLRLLFARFGETDRDIPLSRSLFSFNSEIGQCPQCRGIGKEEKIDLDKLIVDPSKTIREGALAPTLPTGYIMYSQVTIDVLNQVCEAEGFNVDIPWEDLTEEQRNVILYGSEKIKVPFGKHSIESRLKWTGIKAKPREEGYYKGMMPIMSDILRRDRNANILKYVSSVTCSACNGHRLNEDALSVQLNGKGITEIAAMECADFSRWLNNNDWPENAKTIINKLKEKLNLTLDLGLGYLKMDQPVSELAASEAQRIRVINQLTAPLSDVLYVLDEPSIGLHPEENAKMISHLKSLVAKGNTVMVVEHDLETIRSADWIIDLGPQAGSKGGELLFNGSLHDFLESEIPNSPTLKSLKTSKESPSEIINATPTTFTKSLEVNLPSNPSNLSTSSNLSNPSTSSNLSNPSNTSNPSTVTFKIGALNTISGKSGSGKRALIEALKQTIQKSDTSNLSNLSSPSNLSSSSNTSNPSNPSNLPNPSNNSNPSLPSTLIFVDQSPIGRTPRSNPATYLGISDAIRDLFASLEDAKLAKFTKSRFSFNNKGGRCETCQGAGKIQIGMHFLGNIDLVCGTCNGDRFNQATLAIKYQGASIADVYRMSVTKALEFFSDPSNKIIGRIRKGLEILKEIGLGYLTLGQSSTTLSGGEAQRIKIANQLQKKSSGNDLYILMEPSIGLHDSDIQKLLGMFDRIKSDGNTIVCVEQDENIIAYSDWHIQLDRKEGQIGSKIIHQGKPNSANLSYPSNPSNPSKLSNPSTPSILLNNVQTNGLKNINVSIPKNKLTIVTGVSGSGKSSLVYDTLFSEASARFSESLSTYSRSLVQQNSTAVLESFSGMTPAIALRRRNGQNNKRSTVGTLTGIYDHFRLLFARIAEDQDGSISAQHFSFNHHLGACETCKGMGTVASCDPDKVVVHPNKSILNGALSENKSLKYYSNPNGQFMATLQTIAAHKNWDLSLPWNELSEEIQEVILNGTGKQVWNVTWHFQNKSRSGVQELESTWLGFCGYIDDEYERKRQNKNIQSLEDLLHDVTCPECNGARLKKYLLQTTFLDKNIAEWMQLSIAEIHASVSKISTSTSSKTRAIADKVLPPIIAQLDVLENLGLSYLSLDRNVKTLSGGEYQRVLLSGQLNSNLHGVTYILDEPTIGLDHQQILALEHLLRGILANGNTVVAVEHDPVFIGMADYLIELGPEAGDNGGQVIFQGDREALKLRKDTKTYQLLHNVSKSMKITNQSEQSFTIQGANANNLKGFDVDFNLGSFSAITGVSGSGKSSLMRNVIYQSIVKKRPVNCRSFSGSDVFNEWETKYIDQHPLSVNRTMTPASYLGILDALQVIYSKTDAAKKAGLKKADFSYLSKKGKCPTCGGNGKIKTSLDFMSDVWNNCDTCHGSRYSEDIGAIHWNGLSIGDFLQCSVDQGLELLSDQKIAKTLLLLRKLGLGHIKLGQSANTLSGGESQRLKLAKVLSDTTHLPRLFLLDEPSTGLHARDISNLIGVFREIVSAGDTIICIDHNKQLTSSAEFEIKLGPGSGADGGYLLK